MRKLFNIDQDEKNRILGLHETSKKNYGTLISEQPVPQQAQAGGLPQGLVTDNPDAVTVKSSLDGKDTSVTFMKNGTFVSQIPLDSNNPKSNRGTWKYNPKTKNQFGGGYVEYSVVGADGSVYNISKQELNYDIPGNQAISDLIEKNKPAYAKLPIMTKLLNMDNSVIDMRPLKGGQGAQVASKTPGCPAGCIKDPNYKGIPQKWAASK